MGVNRTSFEGVEVKPYQALTDGGADLGAIGMKAFEAKQEVSLAKPTVSISGPGGMA